MPWLAHLRLPRCLAPARSWPCSTATSSTPCCPGKSTSQSCLARLPRALPGWHWAWKVRASHQPLICGRAASKARPSPATPVPFVRCTRLPGHTRTACCRQASQPTCPAGCGTPAGPMIHMGAAVASIICHAEHSERSRLLSLRLRSRHGLSSRSQLIALFFRSLTHCLRSRALPRPPYLPPTPPTHPEQSCTGG